MILSVKNQQNVQNYGFYFSVCDSVPAIADGSFILSGRNVENVTAVLECNSGYNESAADVAITCQSDGSWTSTDATCIRSKTTIQNVEFPRNNKFTLK